MGLLRSLCRRQARAVAGAPGWFAALPLLLAAAATAGLVRLTVDSNPDLVWVPPASIVNEQKAYFDAAFDPFFRVNQVILALESAPGAVAARLQPPASRPPAGAAPWSATAWGNGSQTDPAGILTREYLLAALALQQALATTPDSTGTVLDDVCYKPIAGKGCLIESPLDYFRTNSALIASLTASTIQQALECKVIDNTPNIPCVSAIGVPVMPEVVQGGTGCLLGPVPGFNASVCGGCGQSAQAVMLTLLLQNTPELENKAARWETEVFLPLASSFTAPGLRVSYMAERSVQDQLGVVAAQNAWIVVVSYLAMFCYIVLALGRFPHPIATRALLGANGIVIVGLSVAASIGIASMCGLHITMIVSEVVPFLILALGVDNMFIVTQAFDAAMARLRGAPLEGKAAAACDDGTPDDGEPEEDGRLGASSGDGGDEEEEGDLVTRALIEALGEVGPTITAAAVSEVAAFGVGAWTGIPALVQFCIVAAMAVAIDYLLQVTWFAAAIVLDARRQAAGRMDCFFCVRVKNRASWYAPAPDTDPATAPIDGDAGGGGLSRGLLAGHTDGAHASSEQPPLLDAEAEGGELPPAATWRHAFWRTVLRGGYVRGFMRRVWAPTLMSKPVGALVLAVYAAMLGVSLYGATQLRLGLEQQLAMPQGSYLTDYFNDQARLGEAGPPAYLVLQNVNYTHPDTTPILSGIVDALSSLSDYVEPPFSSWVADYANWATNATRSYIISKGTSIDCPVPFTADEATFAGRVIQFIADVPINSTCCQQNGYCGAQYSTDVKFLWGLPKQSAAVAGSWSTQSSYASDEPLRVTAARLAAELVPLPPPGHDGQPAGALAAAAQAQAAAALVDGGYGVDDGGCDLLAGYLPHQLLEAAVGRRAVGGGPGDLVASAAGGGVRVPLAALLRGLPAPHRRRLALALAVRGAATGGSTEDEPAAQRRRLVGVEAALRRGAAAAGEWPDEATRLLAALQQAAGAGVASLQQPPLALGDDVRLIPCHVMTTRLRVQLSPLRNQSDFVASMAHVQTATASLQGLLPTVDLAAFGIAGPGPLSPGSPGNFSDNIHTQWLPPAPSSGSAFMYSLTFVYYAQYATIRGVALTLLAVAVGGVLLAGLAATHPAVALITAYGVLSVAVCLIGFVWALNPAAPDPYGGSPWGVSINAVSVVNLAMAVGLSVEFLVHVSSAFTSATGTRAERATTALVTMGSSVVTGITLTKLVGVLVLAWAPSQLFRLYYFRIYMGIIVLGAFHGLVLLPVVLSLVGWASAPPEGRSGDESRRARRGKLLQAQLEAELVEG